MSEKKLAFEVEGRGFKLSAFYQDGNDAQIEITRDGKPHKQFLYPAYKIYNLVAHFEDIVDSELVKDDKGYKITGSDGLGGGVMPKEMKTEPRHGEKKS